MMGDLAPAIERRRPAQGSLEGPSHLGDRGDPAGGLGAQAVADHPREDARRARRDPPEVRIALALHPIEKALEGFIPRSLVRGRAGEHLAEEVPEKEDIRAVIRAV